MGWLRWPLYLLLGLIALVVATFALLLFAPAGAADLVLQRSDADARLYAPSGRVRSGSGDLFVDGRDLGRLHWRVQPGSLLRGRLDVEFTLQSLAHRLDGLASVQSHRQLSLSGVSGHLDEGGLRTLLAPYDIHPSGRLTVHSGHFRVRDDVVVEAFADGHWTGGFVRYFLAGQGWTTELPPLDARLRLHDGDPVLMIEDPAGSQLLDITVDAEGWAHLRIRYRFIAMAGFPWPDAPDPDTVLLEISEQIF